MTVRIPDLPNLGAATDASILVGDHAGSGTFLCSALRDYVLPATNLGAVSDSTQVAGHAGYFLASGIRAYIFNGAMQTGTGIAFAPGQDGNNWGHAPHLFQSNTSGAHSTGQDARAAVSVQHSADGAGINGPANADVGLFVGAAKNNYLTSIAQGEVDGVYIFTEQGELGDSAGILIGASRVDGGLPAANYGQLGIETSVSLVAPTTGAITAAMHNIVGWTITGSITNERYGYVTEARQAAWKAAYVVDTLDESGGGNLPSWDWAFLYRTARTDANRLFGVDGQGRIRLGAAATSRPIYCDGASSIRFRNAADSTDVAQFSNDGSCALGQGIPLADNATSWGATGHRWTALWAVNGTVQTSDPSLKTDVAPLPAALPLIAAIEPITFRWKVGGNDPASGAARPGKRTHWGFDATNVKTAFDAAGMDFGGYVKGEDGSHNLRPDQLIPVLWKAVAELAAELAALKDAKPV